MTARCLIGSCALVLVGGLVAGCAADPEASDVPSTTSTSTTEPSVAPPVDCPNFVTEVETGPEPTDYSEDGPISQAQNRLQGDVEAAMAYAQQRTDDFGSIRFENSPRVRLVISFTDHLEEHCAALRDLLTYPDEFELVLAPVTEAELYAIQDDVVAMAGEYIQGAGSSSDSVGVSLRADGEAVAAEIAAKYGDLVTITVGALGYPDRTTGGFWVCSDLVPPPPSSPTFLVAALKPIESPVTSGHDFEAVVTVTNTGGDIVAFESGSPLTALVYLPRTDEVVGIYTGSVAGVGVSAELGPGESIDIEVVGGTASCDPELGYALPPGDYEVRVAVDQYEYPDGGFELHAILSEPTPLTVSG
ncbi:MAG TPA: hypothetical protein VLA29_13560 [Acidimicrobiia bacterium]|nr:hypothetical protein [Acidimicrobiia bacterium]